MMRFSTLVKHPADWMSGSEGRQDIVLTSRVRLARNLAAEPFPGWAGKKQRLAVLDLLRPQIEGLPAMRDAFSSTLDELSVLQKQVLVERHLISRELAARGEGSAVIANRKQTLSLLVNEEDHLRMQGIRPGLCLGEALALARSADNALQEDLDFAFDPQFGYLTACPTNLGTGIRASAMLHLPGLVLAEHMQQVFNAAAQHQYAVRGLYGEGSESLGNLFQVSNQSTLGESEEEVIDGLERFIRDLASAEENARRKLLEDSPRMIEDRVGRAYGVLRHARVIDTSESLNLLSLVRLGASLGFFPEEAHTLCDSLLMGIQPAHLQLYTGSDLDVDERDALRAEMIRGRLQNLETPVMSKAGKAKAAMPALPDPDEPTPDTSDE